MTAEEAKGADVLRRERDDALAEVERLRMIIGLRAEEHYQYLPAAVDYDCCGGCNQETGSYVPWPCGPSLLLAKRR